MFKEIAFTNYNYLVRIVTQMTSKLYADECVGLYKQDLHSIFQSNSEFLHQLHVYGLITAKQVRGMQQNAFNIFTHYGEEF